MSITLSQKSQRVIVRIDRLGKTLPRNLRKGLYFVGKKLRQTASDNIKKRGRRGRVYKFKGRRHVASVPNESWANRSGEARRGLIYKVRGSQQLLFGNTVEYAKFLEFGTKNMAPRPAHLISIRKNNRNIVSIIGEEIKKSFTK